MYLGGGSAQSPWMQTPSPLDTDLPGCRPPPLDVDLPGCRLPLSNACWEANPPFTVHAGKPTPSSQCMLGSQIPYPLWIEGMTHACENITLPKTSFAGGKDIFWISMLQQIIVHHFFQINALAISRCSQGV